MRLLPLPGHPIPHWATAQALSSAGLRLAVPASLPLGSLAGISTTATRGHHFLVVTSESEPVCCEQIPMNDLRLLTAPNGT
jgi:hypothetical protein